MNSKPSSNGYPHRRVDKEAGMKTTESGGKAASVDTPSGDPFVYLTTCKSGHHVQVHLRNGSVYSGIFDAAYVDNNFGIILKTCLTREGSLRGSKPSKPLSKLFIILAGEVAQVIAKDLSVHSNSLSDSAQCEKPLELLTDSCISQSLHVDSERELERWVPDEDVPDCPDLENVFDDPWKRGWNQFEVNETLFGVTSTFDEELYTTKLERGPGTKELEEQALRIAREIEGENTRDFHVAEERGLQLCGEFDIDEETKYSSVCPVNGFDDSGYEEEEEEEEILLDCSNNLTGSDSNNISNESQLAEQINGKSPESSRYREPSEESVSGLDDTNEDAATSHSGKSESSCWLPKSSISRNSEKSAASSPSSPRSSVGSCSSGKSTLNPNAKEFKLNPNAKSFKPSPRATLPQSPVPEGSFYCPPGPPMPGIHIGYGMGAAFPGQQPMVYYSAVWFKSGILISKWSTVPPPTTDYGWSAEPGLFMPPLPYQPGMPYKGRDSY